MDVERALISKIIQTGNLEEAISRGIREDLFADEECRGMFRYVLDYKMRYGGPPSKGSVEQDKPKWEFEYEQESLSALLDRFVNVAKRRLANEMVLELAAACDDPQRSANIDLEFLEVSRKLANLVPSVEADSFTKNMGSRIEIYKQRRKEGRVRGIPTGFVDLDRMTGGIKPHQFWTIAGFTGTGKSTFLKAAAFNAWVQGESILYFSLEEDGEEIYERLDAMAAQIDYSLLRALNLPDTQVQKWLDYADSLRETVHDIPVIEGGRYVTPDLVYAEMVRYQPSLVIIDYISLMTSSSPSRGTSMWQSLTEITRDLKLTARTLKIPIFAAAQTNRSGGKDGAELDNVGYSLSVVQDPDVSLGLFSDEEMKENKEMEVRINKNRKGPLGKIRCIWDHENAIYREKTIQDKFQRSTTTKDEDSSNPFGKSEPSTRKAPPGIRDDNKAE